MLPVNDEHFGRYIVPLRFHIAGGIGALLVGPWQFSEGLRRKALNFHRWLGRFYLLEVALGSVAGLAMATVSEAGIAAHLGFGAVAILWFLTGLQAYRSIRRGDNRGPPPLDDPELCTDARRGNAAQLFAPISLRIALEI
ncbi:MAG: hypothetical protein NVS9B14_07240 [Candidatus Acidiferrum sp.]